jgi:hypothetical protein
MSPYFLPISWSPTSPGLGQAVAFTCVAISNGQPVFDGAALQFWLDGVSAATSTTNYGSGSATWTTSSMTVGTHDVGCSSGDSNYNSARTDASLTVSSKAAPVVTVYCSPTQIVKGASATCSGAVSGGATGTVSLSIGGASWTTVPLSNGTFSATGFSTTPVGSYTVAAAYNGDAFNNPASSAALLNVSSTTSPSIYVTSNNVQVPPGGILYISSAPAMPQLTIVARGVPCSKQVWYNLSIYYHDSNDKDTDDSRGKIPGMVTEVSYNNPANGVSGGTPWPINWNPPQETPSPLAANAARALEGGIVTVSWTVEGSSTQQITFYIKGTPPIPQVAHDFAAATTAGKDTAAWFWLQILNHESNNDSPAGTLQYYNSGDRAPGYPVWGTPHGYGISQVDPPSWWSYDADLWDWKQNIYDGSSKLESTKNASLGTSTKESHFDQQLDLAQKDGHPVTTLTTPVIKGIKVGGNCAPTYPYTSATSNTFEDADWIKIYQGGYFVEYRQHAWAFNRLNYGGGDYVAQVCATRAL